MKTNYTLCDYKQCPLRNGCARYLEGMDRTKTYHFGSYPYKSGKCSFYEPLTEDDLIERVNAILKPFHQ